MRFTDRIYAEVNAAWPSPLPTLRREEAVKAAKRLIKFATGRRAPREVKVTSGRRYTWVIRGVLVVNPSRGWKDLVHDLSHACHNMISTERPHSEEHAQLELKMVRWVIASGWLDGRLQPSEKPKPTAFDRLVAKHAKIEARIARWETKAKRAATALKKLKKQHRAIERNINKHKE